MDKETAAGLLAGRMPITKVRVNWDGAGYVTAEFNAWAGSPGFIGWEGDRPAEEEVRVMVSLLELKRGDSVLDLACGYGRHAEILARDYGMKVVGVDIAPGLINAAVARARERGYEVEYRVGRAADLDYAGSFNAVIVAFNSFSLFSPEEAPGILSRIGRALKEGGRLFMDLDNKEHCLRSGEATESWERWEFGWKLQETFFDGKASVETGRDIYVDERNGTTDEFVVFKRLYSLPEIRGVLSEGGFTVTSAEGDWGGAAVCASNPKIILTAAKSG